MLEQYILTFCHYFDGLGNLIIKLALEIQYRIKHNDEKIIVHFSTMSFITSQNLKLKYNLYIEKQKIKISLRCWLDQLK